MNYKIIPSLIMVFLAIILSNCSNKKQYELSLNKNDSITMIRIFQQIGPWGNEWDFKDINTWDGVTIAFNKANKEYRVIEFDYFGNFKGSIPSDFKNLSELRRLGLGGGELEGPIPAWIGELKNLEYLYIGYNQVENSIPKSIGKLKNLKTLILGNNNIEGVLPEEIGELKSLENLNIMKTKITGEIPSSLKKLSKIKSIVLTDNKFHGEFPIELLNSRFMILCSNNDINNLPFEVWLDENNLIPPDLQGNRLSGIFPDTLRITDKTMKYGFCVKRQQNGYGYLNLN